MKHTLDFSENKLVQDKAIKNLSDSMVYISQKAVEFETNIESNKGDIANNVVQLNDLQPKIQNYSGEQTLLREIIIKQTVAHNNLQNSFSEKTTNLETDIQNNKDGASDNSDQLISLKTELEKLSQTHTNDVEDLEKFHSNTSQWCQSLGTVYI